MPPRIILLTYVIAICQFEGAPSKVAEAILACIRCAEAMASLASSYSELDTARQRPVDNEIGAGD